MIERLAASTLIFSRYVPRNFVRRAVTVSQAWSDQVNKTRKTHGATTLLSRKNIRYA
jgi:hypothetical protein